MGEHWTACHQEERWSIWQKMVPWRGHTTCQKAGRGVFVSMCCWLSGQCELVSAWTSVWAEALSITAVHA